MESSENACPSPPLIIAPGNPSGDTSFPRRLRMKKPISRASLATDRFSCTSFLTTASNNDSEGSWNDLPRWRSLPSNLEEEVYYDDCPDILRAWSRYRLTNMSRRYKTMDYINMMIASRTEMLRCSEIDISSNLSTMTVQGLAVSRDLLFDRDDFSERGSTNITRCPSDDRLSWNGDRDEKSLSLTEANLREALARVTAAVSCESLDKAHRKMNKIEQWLFKCKSTPQSNFIDTEI